ncbi:MAG: porin, partial [Leptospira sp.]|nr:porin [Leptospira sp.]
MNRKLRQLFCITPILFIISGGSLIAQAAKPAAPAAAVKPVAAPEKAKEPEKKWYDKVNFSGYVDVYYNYTWNNRQGSTQDTQGTFHTYNKQFAVNAVKLAVDKVAEKDSPWGMTLHMQNGQNIMYQERPYQTTNSIYNMQLLQQAYVSYYLPLMKGLVIDAGKMATHIGNEVLDSKDNQAYTIGYIFFNTI